MKSLEQFKNEITEEGKEEFLAYMKEQTAKGKPSAEAVAEYIRSKGYDVADTDMQPLNDDDLEDVAGGVLGGSGDSCNHNFVYTGAEKDESYYIFWTAHYKEKKCTKCGQYRWEKVD